MLDIPYPSPEESLPRLRRAGWSTGEAGFTNSSGGYTHHFNVNKYENLIICRGDGIFGTLDADSG
jgi:hypothetical protein